jgi:DNA-binding transcriptional MerR regulator
LSPSSPPERDRIRQLAHEIPLPAHAIGAMISHRQTAGMLDPQHGSFGEVFALHSRVKRLYTDRSFRHYTTHGCIDPPEKEGRRSVYRFRHFVQALLVRKLLWERVPSEQIAVLMAGRGTEETERMFLDGTEMVARADGRESGSAVAPGTVETWRRVQVVPGVELHLRNDLKMLGVAELKELLARLETALRGNFR